MADDLTAAVRAALDAVASVARVVEDRATASGVPVAPETRGRLRIMRHALVAIATSDRRLRLNDSRIRELEALLDGPERE